ncbi:MAG: exodeoxyribonuclease VII large subunit [Duodenibacillus sp.]|nr:exodeoxyribonuclease VII large subunit [Duodenibacillus sp.]
MTAVIPFEVQGLIDNLNMMLQDYFTRIIVVGEVHSISMSPGGTAFITLKDRRPSASAQLTCTVYAARWRRRPFDPRPGDVLEIVGDLQVWAQRGSLGLTVQGFDYAGAGELRRRFEELKRTLEREGLFALERKAPLPAYPLRIALLTSPTGAVVHDVERTMRQRAPWVQIRLIPVPVQGEDAAAAIVAGLRRADGMRGIDAVLLVRGGGSLADLQPFNEESVARAIAAMRRPVISGVGHESDTTIADLVADWRAPTPTAAAERVCECWRDMPQRLSDIEAALRRALSGAAAAGDRSLRHCRARLEGSMQGKVNAELKGLARAGLLASGARAKVSAAGARLERAAAGLLAAMQSARAAAGGESARLAARLAACGAGLVPGRARDCGEAGYRLAGGCLQRRMREQAGLRVLAARLGRGPVQEIGLAAKDAERCAERLAELGRRRIEAAAAGAEALGRRLARPDVAGQAARAEALGAAMSRLAAGDLALKGQSHEGYRRQLRALDPRGVLKRGYAIARMGGKAVRSASEVAPGAVIEVDLARGSLVAGVTEVKGP